MKIMWKVSILILLSICMFHEIEALSVRFVTWNVKDNSWMDGGYDPFALQMMLGPIRGVNGTQHIYAITVQENCHLCNEHNKMKLAGIFHDVLLQFGPYKLIDMSMTRRSGTCESVKCSVGLHGTTVTIVFALRGVLAPESTFKRNGCDSSIFFRNTEKGIAGVKTKVHSSSKSLCFAGLHLDVKSVSSRTKCITQFYADAKGKNSWDSCDVVIMGGDFNVRSSSEKNHKGDKARPHTSYGKEYFRKLRETDEFTGNSSWAGSTLVSKINRETGFHFVEPPLNFLPTYSTLQPIKCGGVTPCYTGSRIPGWTDRIVCSGCHKVKYYNSLLVGLSDHDPVIGVYVV